MPQVEAYDGSKDPLDCLELFKTLMHTQKVLDEIICRTFLTTLKGPTQVWFSKLTPNTVSTFKELSGHFLIHFIRGQRYKRSSASLLNIKQWEEESLRSYVTRFNRKALLIDEADTKLSSLHSPMGCNLESSFSLSTRTTWRRWSIYCARPRNTWMPKM